MAMINLQLAILNLDGAKKVANCNDLAEMQQQL
jgi:hypothetical protein